MLKPQTQARALSDWLDWYDLDFNNVIHKKINQEDWKLNLLGWFGYIYASCLVFIFFILILQSNSSRL